MCGVKNVAGVQVLSLGLGNKSQTKIKSGHFLSAAEESVDCVTSCAFFFAISNDDEKKKK